MAEWSKLKTENMKVFKFWRKEYYYVFAAQTKELSISEFQNQVGDEYVACEEIPESRWDIKNINIHKFNDTWRKPFKESIRGLICGAEPQLLCTNDQSIVN